MIGRIFSKINVILTQLNYKYLFEKSVVVKKRGAKLQMAPRVKISKSSIRFRKGSDCTIEDGVRIKNSLIILENGATLIIEKGVLLDSVKIEVKNGTLAIGHNTIIEKGYAQTRVPIFINGRAHIGHHNRLRGKIKVQFGGVLSTGEYTNINEESEIRCDEKITLGDFVRVSYKCVIWDTNTHNNYLPEVIRSIRISKFPSFGLEFEKPKTKPVHIGDDCWIGREAAILKGAKLSNKVIVGYRTVVSNTEIEENTTVVTDIRNVALKTSYTQRELHSAGFDIN